MRAPPESRAGGSQRCTTPLDTHHGATHRSRALRRVSRSLEEASADLGADSWTTFRYVTFPAVRSALLAGSLLGFALSFDEVIVTIFTAGVVAILLSVIPVYLATRLSSSVVGART